MGFWKFCEKEFPLLDEVQSDESLMYPEMKTKQTMRPSR